MTTKESRIKRVSKDKRHTNKKVKRPKRTKLERIEDPQFRVIFVKVRSIVIGVRNTIFW